MPLVVASFVLSHRLELQNSSSASVPKFKLAVRIRNQLLQYCSAAAAAAAAAAAEEEEEEEERVHESTLAKFLSLTCSSPEYDALASTMSLPDIDPLTNVCLGRRILQFAIEKAAEAEAVAELAELSVAAEVTLAERGGGEEPAAGRTGIVDGSSAAAAAGSLQESEFTWEEEGEGATECAVCLEEFVRGECVARTWCRHVFHGDCVVEWLIQQADSGSPVSCPVCRSLYVIQMK